MFGVRPGENGEKSRNLFEDAKTTIMLDVDDRIGKLEKLIEILTAQLDAADAKQIRDNTAADSKIEGLRDETKTFAGVINGEIEKLKEFDRKVQTEVVAHKNALMQIGGQLNLLSGQTAPVPTDTTDLGTFVASTNISLNAWSDKLAREHQATTALLTGLQGSLTAVDGRVQAVELGLGASVIDVVKNTADIQAIGADVNRITAPFEQMGKDLKKNSEGLERIEPIVQTQTEWLKIVQTDQFHLIANMAAVGEYMGWGTNEVDGTFVADDTDTLEDRIDQYCINHANVMAQQRMHDIMNASEFPAPWLPGVRRLIAEGLANQGHTAPPSPGAAASPSGSAASRKRVAPPDSGDSFAPATQRPRSAAQGPEAISDIEQRLRALEQFMQNGTGRADIYGNQQPPPTSANYEPPP